MKLIKSLSAFLLLAIATTTVQAQEGFGTNSPDQSSVVDMKATDKGVLLPRVALTSLTDVTTVTSPADALTVFNTATTTTGTDDVTPGYYYWSLTDSKWVRVGNALADLRMVGTNNHISQDAGVGSNGTDAGTGTGGNTAIGLNALSSITTGFDNIAIGIDALASGNDVRNNIALGESALASYVDGHLNIALGHNSLMNHVSGDRNIAMGFNTLLNHVDGIQNLGFGTRSLESLTNGDDNIAIGFKAGNNLVTGSKNIIIGSKLHLPSTTATNQLNIGNLIYGTDLDGEFNVLSTGNIGIGVKAPSNKLHVVATADPVRLEGLQVNTAGNKSLTVDANGVVKESDNMRYSTTEATPTGETWIDGKEIYRKVYPITINSLPELANLTIDAGLGPIIHAEFAQVLTGASQYMRFAISADKYNSATGVLSNGLVTTPSGVSYPITLNLIVKYVKL